MQRTIPATVTRYSYQQKDNTVCVYIEFDKQQALWPFETLRLAEIC